MKALVARVKKLVTMSVESSLAILFYKMGITGGLSIIHNSYFD